MSKFDGTTWSTYTETDGLVSNYIRSIAFDNEGNKWFGSNGGGVSTFDDRTLTNFPINENVTKAECISNTEVTINPLPIIDKLIITFSGPISQEAVFIYNLNGIKVYSTTIKNSTIEIDMSNFASGLYIIKIVTTDETVLTRKILKQ